MEKERHTEVIECRHCGNRAPMLVVATFSDEYEEGDNGYHWTESKNYELVQCPSCREVTLRYYFWHDGYMESAEDTTIRIFYPGEKSIPRGLPPELAKEFNAADQVRRASPNAYGVLLRRVLELVCEDRSAEGDTLYLKLKDLADRDEIPSKLVTVAQSLRGFGNVGAHASLGNLTDKEVPVLENLTRAILEYVYSAPALAEAAVQRLTELQAKKPIQKTKKSGA